MPTRISISLCELERAETGKIDPGPELTASAGYFELYSQLIRALHGDTIDLGPGAHAFTRREPWGVWGGEIVEQRRDPGLRARPGPADDYTYGTRPAPYGAYNRPLPPGAVDPDDDLPPPPAGYGRPSRGGSS